MRVHALLPDLGWTIGVYAPDGTNLYFAAASADRETTINLSIIPADDRFLGLPAQDAAGRGPRSDHRGAEGLHRRPRARQGRALSRARRNAVLAKASCAAGRDA